MFPTSPRSISLLIIKVEHFFLLFLFRSKVKNLDARITDVLGKLKEREISLKTHASASSTDNEI